jgi:hypothetical protein
MVRLVGVDVHGFPSVKTIFDHRAKGGSDHLVYPALDVNKDGTVGLTYTRVGAKTYPGVADTTHHDGTNVFAPTAWAAQGFGSLPGVKHKNFANLVARWVDCAGAAVDPSDLKSIWFASTYVDANAKSKVSVSRVLSP